MRRDLKSSTADRIKVLAGDISALGHVADLRERRRKLARIRAGGLDRLVGQADLGVIQRARLCARAAITVQALLAVMAGGEVREGLVFEVADDQFDLGVVAVIDIGGQHRHCVRLVRKQWWRQSGHSSSWEGSLSRVRRTISRQVA